MITVSGKALGSRRPLFADWSVPFPPDLKSDGDSLTLRELIARIVAAEVEKFNARQVESQTLRALTEKQIATLRAWVEQGARWQNHWSLLPPRRPDLPAVKDRLWPRNAIDHFVLARLEKAGLRPSPEGTMMALPYPILRRLSSRCTGRRAATLFCDTLLDLSGFPHIE